ncbi:hypothetical protein EJ04DRAFT_490170 [Polyplosphaeria fusca]|uniref:Rhodopsin domain-containing protein n=1 Tax=Polyplosphaeria fusca TaxID=682080 RepID=A0A9P4V4G4_9PLEO|nr:hypothetical protein EJ04DRAFT_490170 [Polyplosphaeria fusca]
MAGLQPVIIWLNAVLMALTFAAICSRVGRRVFLVGVWSWHDFLITLAAICAFVFSIFQIVGTNYGLGLHKQNVSSADMTTLSKLVMASNVFYFACNWAVKHALLLFYSEITREKKHIVSIYIMHFVAFGFGLSSILVDLFQCRPFHKAWDGDTPGYCVRLDIFFYINGSIMLTTDLILYIMPVVFTWNLQLRRPQRIGLNALFALGGLVLASSAARLKAVHKLAPSFTKSAGDDFSWWFANAMIWSVLENHLAIVVACAPSVKVIALLFFPRLASSYRKVVSKVTPSGSSRSRSRASRPFEVDIESGTRQTDNSDKLKLTPLSTPLPSPAYTAGSGISRQSRNFAKWFKGPSSPRGLTSADSLEESGLVYVEDINHNQNHNSRDLRHVDISRQGRGSSTPSADNDIRVQHTIEVESTRESTTDEEMGTVGKAA